MSPKRIDDSYPTANEVKQQLEYLGFYCKRNGYDYTEEFELMREINPDLTLYYTSEEALEIVKRGYNNG